ncbi:MAG: class C sortase [Lachnospiraceae bacterium]|nr:class C sortase [Lachnospiraceae bacterium]
MIKNIIFKVLAALFLASGLILTGYPLISDYLFEMHTKDQVEFVRDRSDQIEDNSISEWILTAREYNEKLYETWADLLDPFGDQYLQNSDAAYQDTLSLDESGIMGYIEIPAIDIEYPIFHGTTEDVLLQGIGHVQGSSFPVGGENSHAVLAGHSGLNQRRLFTDLDNLEPGNVIYIHVFNEELIYEVYQTIVIEAGDTDYLRIIPGEDMITLVTCTPYGVNSHRFLVQAKRVKAYGPKQDLYEKERSYAKPSIYEKRRNQDLILLVGFVAVMVIVQVCLNYFIMGKSSKVRRTYQRKRS